MHPLFLVDCSPHLGRTATVRNSRWIGLVVLSISLSFAGCQGTHHVALPTAEVAQEVQGRTHTETELATYNGNARIPPMVELTNGLTEEEAVALALWNNAAFHETLARLGLAQGDLIQAGLLTNPSFQTFLPVGPKQFEFTMNIPVEALLLRPRRLKIASSEYLQIGQELVQNGLNLVRDVKVAYSQLAYAERQSQLATEGLEVRQKIFELSDKRLKAGDISQLELSLTRAEKLKAEVRAREFSQQVELARQRLNALMGFPGGLEYEMRPVLERHPQIPTAEELVQLALQSRPDLRSTHLAIEATEERAKIARWTWLRVDGIIDANSEGTKGFEIGPGLRFDVPLFDRSQGQIARAQAVREAAERRYYTLRDQITQEVKTALLSMNQADTNLSQLRQDYLPVLQESVAVAEKAYEKGDTPYFNVLQLTSQYLTTREQELTFAANLQQAQAELERSIGQSLHWQQPAPSENSEPLPPAPGIPTPAPVPQAIPVPRLLPPVGAVEEVEDRVQITSQIEPVLKPAYTRQVADLLLQSTPDQVSQIPISTENDDIHPAVLTIPMLEDKSKPPVVPQLETEPKPLVDQLETEPEIFVLPKLSKPKTSATQSRWKRADSRKT